MVEMPPVFAAMAWATVICVLFVMWFRTKTARLREMVNKIPGPPGWPLIGNAIDLHVDHADFLDLLVSFSKKYAEVRGIWRFWLGPQPYAAISKGRAMEPIMNSSRHIDKSIDYTFLHPWLGTGLLTSTGDKWKIRRKMLTPAFHFRILEDFVDVFNEQSEILVRRLAGEVGKESFNMSHYITLCALDIICDSAMGKHVHAQNDNDSDYVKAVYGIGDIIHSRQMRLWMWPDLIFNLTSYGKDHARYLNILHGFTNKVIQERKKDLNLDEVEARQNSLDEIESTSTSSHDPLLGRKTRFAFLDLLLHASDHGKVLTDDDIREEVDTFMFEGHDTTASGISWALFLLGGHPEIQKLVHEELDAIFGDSDRRVTSEDVKNMKYLECVIKEALRLFPSVPMIGRHLKEDVELDGYTVPKGVTAIIITYMLHRDPEVFPDPEVFNPERFLPENCLGRHPYAYIPFSAGPRNCIGQRFAMMEEKVVLSTVLRSYQVHSLEKRDEVRPLAELILRPQTGFKMRIQSRK